MEMENFSVGETRMSSPTVPESCELTLPAKLPAKPKHLQGIISTETESISGADWTDEKHSLYLKFMEASFVNQLYDSKEMRGWRSPNSTTTSSSGQFKVLRGGSWQKIKFGRNNSKINTTYECHDLKVNPWPSAKHCAMAMGHPTHEDILCNETETGDVEMSDQNFVDEEVQGERENNRSRSKRMKSCLV